MKALLDTHVLLWALADDPKLPNLARRIISDQTNKILYSTASIWEVSIKHAAHPDKMRISGADLVALCEKGDFEQLPIFAKHVAALETLLRPKESKPHNDPFDRIMISQAKADALTFITHDSLIAGYQEPCVLSV